MIITDASSLVGIMKREEYVNYKTTANLLIINKGRKILSRAIPRKFFS